MVKFNDMTTEPIKKTLILLALPIMGASFFQLAYGIVDMLWIGKLGSRAVAAVGSAAFFINKYFIHISLVNIFFTSLLYSFF